MYSPISACLVRVSAFGATGQIATHKPTRPQVLPALGRLPPTSTGSFTQAARSEWHKYADGLSNTYLFGEKYLSPDHYATGEDGGDNETVLMGDNGDIDRWTTIGWPPHRIVRAIFRINRSAVPMPAASTCASATARFGRSVTRLTRKSIGVWATAVTACRSTGASSESSTRLVMRKEAMTRREAVYTTTPAFFCLSVGLMCVAVSAQAGNR